MKYYNQVFADLDRGVRPQSRETMLETYMQKYFPTLTRLYPSEVQGFIQGDIEYSEMCQIVDRAKGIRRIQNNAKRQTFDAIELAKYGPRSLPPRPYTFEDETDLVIYEYDRFRKAFGPGEKSLNRVPGTYDTRRVMNYRFGYLLSERSPRGNVPERFGIF